MPATSEVHDTSVNPGHRLCIPTPALVSEGLFDVHTLPSTVQQEHCMLSDQERGPLLGFLQEGFLSFAAVANACNPAANVTHVWGSVHQTMSQQQSHVRKSDLIVHCRFQLGKR